MSPNELIEELIDMFPSQDSMIPYLLFWLMLFFGLYLVFQFIFWLGRDRKKKPKAESAKKDVPKSEPKPEAKPEPKPAPAPKANKEKEKLIILEEPKPAAKKEEPINPYYAHENNASYITSSANVEIRNHGYGDNYLYNYYQEVASRPKVVKEPTIEGIKASDISENSKMQQESDKIIATYASLPDELKRYILNKILYK